MFYSSDEVLQYVRENDVKFIRLAFCDICGTLKNIAIMPSQLERALDEGITLDPRALRGFQAAGGYDLLLKPDPSTLTAMPWRPQQGRVVRLMSSLMTANGEPFVLDTREILRRTVREAIKPGYTFRIGTECEFYLFETDENGKPTHTPQDNATYCDIAPVEKAENVRREICLTLEEMGISPESSHHEVGPGQNEVDFAFADVMSAADNAVLFKQVVRTVAAMDGLHASFMPKPLRGQAGSGMHINLSAYRDGRNIMNIDGSGRGALTGDAAGLVAGIMRRLPEMTALLNPITNSYERLSDMDMPGSVGWSLDNSQVVRLPHATGERARMELRSPDSALNPYIAFSLIIAAGMEGIRDGLTLPAPRRFGDLPGTADMLPRDLRSAIALSQSEFISSVLPAELLNAFTAQRMREIEFVENSPDRTSAESDLYFMYI
ncbi:MAG: glutamine synthetase family protein [Clostridiales bacterium]|nr:glutamine synthetase family protein [Clostridiales bacterium]MDY4201140.1 glutamine synthetase family protein [Candidatus Fimadaptatus sp.]